MPKERINPPDVFQAHFAHAIKAGNTIYVAGQIGLTPERELAGTDAYSQAKQAFENIKRILAHAGAEMSDIVMMRIHVTEVAYVKEVQEARKDYLTEIPPGTILVVKSLASDRILVELEATAVIEP